MRTWLAVFLMAIVALSGCAKDEPKSGEGTQDADPDTEVLVPTWAMGDYWTYETFDEGDPNGARSFIVTGETSTDWIVDTNEPTVAYYNAIDDISLMGQIRKSDLAGSQAGSRVQFLQFPLVNGDTWTTSWDGYQPEITVHDMGQGIFHMMAHVDDWMMAEYFFDVEVGWITDITWFDQNDTEQWKMQLTDSGNEFTGTVYRYDVGETHVYNTVGSEVVHETLDLDAEWNEIKVTAVLMCDGDSAGQVQAGINPATSDPRPLPMAPFVNTPDWGAELDCTKGDFVHDTVLLENIGGTWEIGIIAGGQTVVAHMILEERNLEALAFPFI